MVSRASKSFVIAGLVLAAIALGACSHGGYGSLRPADGASPVPTVSRDRPALSGGATRSSGRGSVTVRRGDTVYGIARANGVDLKEVITLNRLTPPYLLRVGDVLKLPQPQVYVVQRGDTGYGISRKYGIELTTLVRMNGLRRPYRLQVGQKLRLPAGARLQETKKASAGSSPKAAVPEPPARSGRGFLWPLEGKILSGFGPQAGGLQNDGINISAREGARIRAAEAGVVAYAGDELRGYGNLLLIRHEGGWITAYAHNRDLLVARGDRVARGQVIASAGATGGVREPQLHFEIRKGRRAIDPLNYLPKTGKNAP